jgi:lipid-A-disaccharide synthase
MQRPAAVILIDYPGFNLRFARKLRKFAVPAIYYISPQLWAWGRRRVYKIKKYIDQMLVIFPFEKSFYDRYGVRSEYVGHPLADHHFHNVFPKKMTGTERVLGLLPGSRQQELEKLLPDMIQTAKLLFAQGVIDSATILRAQTIPASIYKSHIGDENRIRISNSTVADFYNSLDAALVTSGTATLETAYFQVPLVIVYRVSILTWLLGKLFVKLKMIGLVNIVASKLIAVELLQNDFTPSRAVEELKILLDPKINAQKREELKIISEKLGKPGASEQAAALILQSINSRRS